MLLSYLADDIYMKKTTNDAEGPKFRLKRKFEGSHKAPYEVLRLRLMVTIIKICVASLSLFYDKAYTYYLNFCFKGKLLYS